MRNWLWRHVTGHGPEEAGSSPGWLVHVKWPTSKPPAFLTLDDRAIRFDGKFPPLSELVNFKPWNYGAIHG